MLTRGHLNIRSLSRRYNRLFKGSSKPCSGLSSRDRRENLAWYARPGFPTGWSPPTHQIQELELMFKCPLVRVIQVKEFADIPVLCKRSYDNVLREGACYVRSRRKPETSEIPTLADMRDLLDLATEKRLREHLALLERIGLIVLPSP